MCVLVRTVFCLAQVSWGERIRMEQRAGVGIKGTVKILIRQQLSKTNEHHLEHCQLPVTATLQAAVLGEAESSCVCVLQSVFSVSIFSLMLLNLLQMS